MWSTEIPGELGPAVAPEFIVPDDPESDGLEEAADTRGAEVQAAEWEESFEQGVLGLSANGRQRSRDGDDDSDLAADDFDDADLDDDLDDDLEDADEDEDLDDDLDEQIDDDEDEL